MVLINPKGESKEFKGGEFYSYLLKVERNIKFQEWARLSHLQVRYSNGNGMMLNTGLVKSYLEFLGYKMKREPD